MTDNQKLIDKLEQQIADVERNGPADEDSIRRPVLESLQQQLIAQKALAEAARRGVDPAALLKNT